MNLYQQFLDYIDTHQLFSPHDVCLLGVSGGVDSVVLAHLLHRANIPFVIAHCHFKLRSAADQEALFVQRLAQQYNVACHQTAFHTKHYAKTHKLSIQMAARKLRYDWFQQLKQQHKYTVIATAHHHYDQLETCLYNFIKGTNVCGLQGMLPRSEAIVRPLLFATKPAIYAYAQANNLTWHEDQSNQSLAYRRNWIRHKVIPLLTYVNPNIHKTLFTTLNKLQQTQTFFEAHAHGLQKKLWSCKPPYYYIAYQELTDAPWTPVLLTHWLKPFGFTFRSLLSWCTQTHQTGRKIYSPTHWLMQNRDTWVLGPRTGAQQHSYTIDSATTNIVIPHLYQLFLRRISTITVKKSSQEAWIDYNKLTFPLHVRRWQTGDRFCPLGMQGKHKKISDLLIDQKIPRYQKDHTYVLCQQQQIVWVIGHRIDDRFKITSNTQQALHITLTHTQRTMPSSILPHS